jgi:hypothetical protein
MAEAEHPDRVQDRVQHEGGPEAVAQRQPGEEQRQQKSIGDARVPVQHVRGAGWTCRDVEEIIAVACRDAAAAIAAVVRPKRCRSVRDPRGRRGINRNAQANPLLGSWVWAAAGQLRHELGSYGQ